MIVVQTPLRISFLGGGTDFEDYYRNEGGAVLSTAINLSVYVIIKERFDDDIYINYTKKEIVDSVDKIDHDLVREAMRITGINNSVEITTLADVTSEGSGLGSSSSLTVALLHAMSLYRGELPTAQWLADQACKIEIDLLKRPIGRQDQYIAAYGNLRFITFHDSTISVEKVNVSRDIKDRLNRNLMLFYTGRSRKSLVVLESQKNNIENRMKELNQIKRLAYDARECIENGQLDNFGELLHHGWENKKKLSERVSDNEIDRYYTIARSAGAIGGKICGAGGGGFLLLYCRSEKQDSVRSALRDLKEFKFSMKDNGSRVIFNYQGYDI